MKLFHKHFYGDGEEQPLPSTRRQSFAYYGREHFGKLIMISALCALFFLPALVWLFIMNYNKAKYIAGMDTAAENYAIALKSYMQSFTLTTYGVFIPLVALFFVGLAGCAHSVQQLCFGKNIRFADYFRGIKQNGLRFALFGIVFGIAFFTLRFNIVYFNGAKPLIYGLFIGGAALLLLLVCLILLYCIAQSVTYKATFGQIIKNAVILTFAKFFANTGMFLLAAVPFILTLLIPSPFQLLGLLLLTLFYTGYAALALMCYFNYVFDKTINPKLGEEHVGRGLAKPTTSEADKTDDI